MPAITLTTDKVAPSGALESIVVPIYPTTITDEAIAELSSWDDQGRVIAAQIINRFPHLFPYFIKH